ncbi:MAG: NAD(P)H-dependent oxidoreductase subunit E [Planctomycetaceae bacterium]
MELHLMAAAPTAEERAAVDDVLGPPGSSWEGRPERSATDHRVARAGEDRRTLLLPALHALRRAAGWISEGGLGYVCERLQVPPAEAYGVATFYALFSVEPRPARVLHVCDDLACRVNGAGELVAHLEGAVGPERTPTADGGATWHRSPCIGMCELAPAVLVQTSGPQTQDLAFGRADPATIAPFLAPAPAGWAVDVGGASSAPQAAPGASRDGLRLLARVGLVDPGSIGDYKAHGGYAALRRAVGLGPAATIREVADAKLLGRGGAAFPTGVKWKAVAEQPVRPHYVVANADESEPGTFKDRVLLEEDPFALLEALTIAGFATGAEHGFVYLRGEYPRAARHLQQAIEEARRHGYLGEDVMGAGFGFDVELRCGAGAYICGEETALFNSLEGRRGEPRNKPPFPVTNGVFGKPTAINNVETLLNVLPVLALGAEAYASAGTAESTGTRLFCLSGHVARPGVYEAPHGITVREAIALAGGMRAGGPAAVLLGGAAGGFLAPDQLDARLTFEDARAGGYTLGSGVVMAFDDTVDLGDLVLRIARFFRDESCGQCVPCRVGTVRQEEALHRLAAGRALGSREDELALLRDVAQVMRDASICGLGQTAANAVQSAIAAFGVFDGGRS